LIIEAPQLNRQSVSVCNQSHRQDHVRFPKGGPQHKDIINITADHDKCFQLDENGFRWMDLAKDSAASTMATITMIGSSFET
jgi:hypothetical protein